MRVRIACAAVALAFAAQPLLASEPPEVEGIDTEAGETEIEVETRFNLDQGRDEWELQFQAEHGLSDRWSLGGELEFQQDVGDRLSLDSMTVNAKLRSLAKTETPVAWAVSLGGGYAFGEDRPLIESALFVGWSKADWTLSARAKAEMLLGRSAEPELTYRARLEREFAEGLRLGIESSGDVLAEDDLTHRLGPILSLELKGEDAPEIGLGAFVGLNRATADIQIRAEIEFGF